MSNIRGIGSVDSKKKDSKLLEQAGTTSGTAVHKGEQLMKHLQEKSGDESQQHASFAASDAKITLFKNGFLLGAEDAGGEFYDLSVPKNQAMVDEMLAGDMPHELQDRIRAQLPPTQKDVGVSFVNKMQDVYVPPKPKFDFAKSQGLALGASAVASAASFAAARARAAVVDESAPSTTIQIVLADKSKVRQKFNLSQTVLDIYQHVQFVSKVATPFDLMNGFPPKPLADPSATISAAGLAGASLTQKSG